MSMTQTMAEARSLFERQIRYEREGEQAARNGGIKADCPYSVTTHPFEWNHWIYGFDNEKGNNEKPV
ncbi:hypothetical protein UFOVP1670_65 [uncultured Caudovirales phage]|uniref:Uncharacterized protein n=1 Tax=uncultured Caudovirales phage TaxID=2100421 RepID=A0A6J5T8K2_9CAUD|nr:hypothetical protein UFOVP1670_65 [uncultured Caudovirales phage]